MAVKTLYAKFIGGNVGGLNLITSTAYKYDAETFEFKGTEQFFDGGEKANKEGYYTFKSIKDFIESKGQKELVEIESNRTS